MKRVENLYFRTSKNKKGQDCFVAKISGEDGRDEIVIANEGVNKVGRWSVTVIPMKNGRGWIVVSAEIFYDSMEIILDYENWEVRVEVNGKDNRLKKEIRGSIKWIPLKLECKNRVAPINLIVENIKRKGKFLQLSPDFSLKDFCERFRDGCDVMVEEYTNRRFVGHIPNTPFADLFEKLKK